MTASSPSHAPAGPLLLAGALVLALGTLVSGLSGGCTAAQLAADGPALEAGMAVACPALTAIPLAGPFVASACQGAEADVSAAVSKAAAELAAADAGAPSAADARDLRPLYATRGGRRRVVGYASACLCAAAQHHLDAMGDAGPDAVPLDASAQSPADAGTEGGR